MRAFMQQFLIKSRAQVCASMHSGRSGLFAAFLLLLIGVGCAAASNFDEEALQDVSPEEFESVVQLDEEQERAETLRPQPGDNADPQAQRELERQERELREREEALERRERELQRREGALERESEELEREREAAEREETAEQLAQTSREETSADDFEEEYEDDRTEDDRNENAEPLTDEVSDDGGQPLWLYILLAIIAVAGGLGWLLSRRNKSA